MKRGITDIIDVKRGTTQISKIMRGTTLIWEKAGFPTDQLFAYYKCEDNNAIDSFGVNDGVNSNVGVVTGKIGNSYSYNGSTSYTNLSALNNKFNGVDFSIGFWYSTTQNNLNRLVQNRGQGGLGSVPGFAIGEYSGYVLLDSGNTEYINFSTTAWNINDGNKHLFILTWNTSSGRARIYTDNVLIAEQTNMNMIGVNLNGLDVLIGKLNQNNQYYNGEIDELAFAQKEWDITDISKIWNNGDGITL